MLRSQVGERYRSGHNGADSKSDGRQRHVGSNPTLSAIRKTSPSLGKNPKRNPSAGLPESHGLARGDGVTRFSVGC